ncbi:unnamed protein product, partial [Symbiodinium necroappetens]
MPTLFAKNAALFYTRICELVACFRNQHLNWPRSAASFQSLSAASEKVSLHPMQRRKSWETGRGVRPELIFGPVAEGLIVWQPPTVSDSMQDAIVLRDSDAENVSQFAGAPMGSLKESFIVSEAGPKIDGSLPVQLEEHPKMKSELAKAAMKRIAADMLEFARQQSQPQLKLFTQGSMLPSLENIEQLDKELCALRSK